jgi:hypothetical protein
VWTGSIPLDAPPTPLRQPAVTVSHSFAPAAGRPPAADDGADYLAQSLLPHAAELSGAASPFRRWAAALQHTDWVVANIAWAEAHAPHPSASAPPPRPPADWMDWEDRAHSIPLLRKMIRSHAQSLP